MKNFLSKEQYNNFVKATDKLSVEEIDLLKLELPVVLETARERSYVFLCHAATEEDCSVTDFIGIWLESVFCGRPMENTEFDSYGCENIDAREKFVKLTFEYLNNKTSL